MRGKENTLNANSLLNTTNLRSNNSFLMAALLFVIIVPTAWAIVHERSLIQRAGATESAAFWGHHELSAQGALVHFQRDSGAGRPYIRDEDGTEIIEYSDWGGSSWIFVDTGGTTGGTEMLYLHPHGYAVTDNMISQSIEGESWKLTQYVTITAPRTVKVDYYLTARSSELRRVQLSLSHYHWYFSDVTRLPVGFQATVSKNLTRSDIDRGVTAPPHFNVSMRTDTPQFLSSIDPVAIGLSDANGVSNVVTRYEVTSLERDIMTLIASEVVTWEPVAQ